MLGLKNKSSEYESPFPSEIRMNAKQTGTKSKHALHEICHENKPICLPSVSSNARGGATWCSKKNLNTTLIIHLPDRHFLQVQMFAPTSFFHNVTVAVS